MSHRVAAGSMVDKIIAYRVSDASEVPLDRLKDFDGVRLSEVKAHVLWKMKPGEGAPEFWVEKDHATAKPSGKPRPGKRCCPGNSLILGKCASE